MLCMLLKVRDTLRSCWKKDIFYISTRSKRYITLLPKARDILNFFYVPKNQRCIMLLLLASDTWNCSRKQVIHYARQELYYVFPRNIPFFRLLQEESYTLLCFQKQNIFYVSPRSKRYATFLPEAKDMLHLCQKQVIYYTTPPKHYIPLLPKVIDALRCSRKQDTH